jgi:hypothetical protein
MKNIEELHKLCEKAMDSIAESMKKLEKDPERLNADDTKYLDHLAHMVKSIKTIEAMEGYYDDESSGDGGWNYNRPYYTSGNYYGNSGARRMRDSMGRYTSRDGGYMNGGNYTYSRDNGYSRDASRKKMVSKLETLMDDTMSDSERMAIEECIAKIEK